MANFSYFDQFTEIEIDLTSYLKSIPITGSKYTLSNKQPVITTVKNLFTKYDIVFDYKNDIDMILKYTVSDGDFIETISYKVYDSVEYWWMVALFNNIKNPFTDWPITQEQVVQSAKTLYNVERKYSYQTYLDYLSAENEAKRNLVLPKKDAVKDIIWKYRQMILKG